MTVSVPVATAFEYAGDGVTAEFSFPLRFLEAGEILVTVGGVEQVHGPHYSVEGAGEPAGGSVIFEEDYVPGVTGTVRLERRTAAKQTVDLSDVTKTPGDTLERQLDRTTMAVQDQAARVSTLEDQFEVGIGPEGLNAYQVAVANGFVGSEAEWLTSLVGLNAYYFETRTVAQAYLTLSGPAYIQIAGYAASGDGGAALYKKVGSEPSHAGKFQIGGGTGAWYEITNLTLTPQMFGAKGDGSTDDTTALGNLATVARALKARIHVPWVSTYYRTSGAATLDWSLIPYIKMDGEIRGPYSSLAGPAMKVGGSGTDRGEIGIRLRNSGDGSTTAGNVGVEIGTINAARVDLSLVRGFNKGVRINGTSGGQIAFIGNAFYVQHMYNNGVHFCVDMANGSYFNVNQIFGGSWFLGTGVTPSNRGTVQYIAADTGAICDNIFYNMEIGIVANSMAADFALLLDADLTGTWTLHGAKFVNCRIELYSGATDKLAVNIDISSTAQITVDADLIDSPRDMMVSVTPQTNARVRITDGAYRAGLSTSTVRNRWTAPPFRPYRWGNNVSVPEHVLFDADYSVPAAALTSGVATRAIKVIEGRLIIGGAGTSAVGKKYQKNSNPAFLEIVGKGETVKNLVIICYDSNGTVLSGTSPYYVQARQVLSRTRGSVTLYEAVSNWVWLHESVASFFIGEARWNSNGEIKGIDFDVTYGIISQAITKDDVPSGRIVNASPAGLFEKVGAAVDGTATNGWRNTFYLDTTLSAAGASSDTTVTLTSVSGITSGDTIGVEIDTTIATGEQQIHTTTVNGAPAGSVVTLTNALPAAAAIGRRVLVNRWVAK